MKIRILDNAIRLRLDRSEVDDIAAGQTLTASTHFPGGQVFGYKLTAAANASDAIFDGSAIVLRIAQATLLAWATDEYQVGFGLPNRQGQSRTADRKDFECLEPRSGEDHSNRFGTPKALARRLRSIHPRRYLRRDTLG